MSPIKHRTSPLSSKTKHVFAVCVISRRWLYPSLMLKTASATAMQLPRESGCLSVSWEQGLGKTRVSRCTLLSLWPQSFPWSEAVLPARWDPCRTPVAAAGSSGLVPFAHSFGRGGRLYNLGLKDFWDWTVLQMNQQFLTPPCWDGICLLRREAADFFVTWLNWQNSGNTCSLLN